MHWVFSGIAPVCILVGVVFGYVTGIGTLSRGKGIAFALLCAFVIGSVFAVVTEGSQALAFIPFVAMLVVTIGAIPLLLTFVVVCSLVEKLRARRDLKDEKE